MRALSYAAAVAAFVAAGFVMPSAARASQTVNWTGVYVGANVGEAINHDTGVMTCAIGGVQYPPDCVYPAYGKMNAIGFLGGVQLGYNLQIGPLVIGPEFDYDGSTLNGSMNFNGLLCSVLGPCALHAPGQFMASESMTSFQTERLRLGFASGNTLIYATGGWAQANWTLSSDISQAVPPASVPASASTQRSGWTYGLGGEWSLSQRMSVKIEGLLYTLQPYATSAPIGSETFGKEFSFHGAVARLGFNWKI